MVGQVYFAAVTLKGPHFLIRITATYLFEKDTFKEEDKAT